MAVITTVATDDDTTVSDGTGRAAIVAVCGSGAAKWGVVCYGGDPKCTVTILGYARRGQGVRAAEWHLRWHRNGEPRCSDCGGDLGRRGATHCPPGTCVEA